MPSPAEAGFESVPDATLSFAEIRCKGREGSDGAVAFLPFCLDGTTHSNALPLQLATEDSTELHPPFSGDLEYHCGECQFHWPTSSVLAVQPSAWQPIHASLASGKFLIMPSRGAAKREPKPSPSPLSLLRRSLGGGGTPTHWPQLKEVSIGAHCRLFMSRRDPRLLGLLFPPDRVILLRAPSADDSLGWVGALAACCVVQRRLADSDRIPVAVVPPVPGSLGGLTGRLEVLVLDEDGHSALSRGGLPPGALSGWQLREVELEWCEMLVLPFRHLLNGDAHKGVVRGRTGLIRIRIAEERVELFAIPGNERMLVLAHGPQRSLLLLRAADAATAREWSRALSAAIAYSSGCKAAPKQKQPRSSSVPLNAPDGAAAAASELPPPKMPDVNLDLKLKQAKQRLGIPEEEEDNAAITAEVLAEMVPIEGPTADQKILELYEKLHGADLAASAVRADAPRTGFVSYATWPADAAPFISHAAAPTSSPLAAASRPPSASPATAGATGSPLAEDAQPFNDVRLRELLKRL
jgi:hypothetical protein